MISFEFQRGNRRQETFFCDDDYRQYIDLMAEWSENSGWQNFRPDNGGVTVNDTCLSGYAWAENIGWVKLGSGTGPYDNTTSANWGVNKDSVWPAVAERYTGLCTAQMKQGKVLFPKPLDRGLNCWKDE